jgi:sporulation protein YlmC with PRC-barrel domain
MLKQLVIGGLLAAAMAIPAAAQSNNATNQDLWRASKLVGVNVYNDKDEKLGDINEVLIDKSGKVAGLVIGVGGFLGMGEHDVMIDMSKLKFVNEPARTAANTNAGSDAAGRTTATTGAATNNATGSNANNAATASNANANSTSRNRWYPDHAVLAGATKDSLKAMQQFKYD